YRPRQLGRGSGGPRGAGAGPAAIFSNRSMQGGRMSTAVPKTKLMTAEECGDWVHQAENENKWFELVRGEVVELPSPLKLHGVVCMNVAWEVNSYVRQRRN